MELRPGYKQTEVGVIPEDWDVKMLGELFEITSSKRVFQSEWKRQGVPFYRARELAVLSESRLKNNELFITREMYESFKRQFGVPTVGDMLVTGVGTLGKTYVVPGGHDFYFKDGNIIWFKIGESISSDFLSQLYLMPVVIKQIDDGSAGTTVGTYTISGAKKTRIPFPPIAEQRAIATALSDVDALLTKLDQLIAKKRDLKQAAMQQLLTGQTRLPGFSGEWDVKRLGECLLARPDYGINAAAVPFSDRLPAYIRITDISENGKFSPVPVVSVAHPYASWYYLNEGDLVFARTGASVGKSYLYDKCDGPLVFAGFLIRVCPNPSLVISAYLSYCVKTGAYWDWVRLMSMRSGQPGINGAEYAQLPLRLPTLPEQTAIAAVLSDMDDEIAALEVRRDKTRALKQGMMQELLTGNIRLV
jgi:type I restriction enzyme, S subunit